MSHLVASSQPAVVFSSLAALSVLGFSDECRVTITEGDDFTYCIQRPLRQPGQPLRLRVGTSEAMALVAGQSVGSHTVSTPIIGARTADEPGYSGTVVHYWRHDHRPTAEDVTVAQLAVDLAGTAVDAERGAATTGDRYAASARTHRGEVHDLRSRRTVRGR